MNNVVNDVVLSPSGRFNFVTKRLKFILIHTVANHLFWPLVNIAFTAKPWYTTWRKWYFGQFYREVANVKPLNISFDFIKVLFIALDLGKLGQPGFYHDFSNLLNWTKSTNFNDLVSSQIIREWHSMIIRSRCWGHVESMLIILWPMGCKSSQ